MNAYEFLSCPRAVKARLGKVQDRIASLQAVAERATVRFGPEFDPVSHTRNPSAMQDMIIRLAEAKEEETGLKKELAEVELEVGLVLARLQDKEIFDFMTYRFLDCMPVRKAAFTVGYSYSWGRKAQAKGIREVQSILDHAGYSEGDETFD